MSDGTVEHFPGEETVDREVGADEVVSRDGESLGARRHHVRDRGHTGGNGIKIGLPGKLILIDYFQENRTSRRPFL